MKIMNNFWIFLGSISCALCVIIGAFGAHGLKDILSEYGKDVYEKGNLYHFFHSIALIINGLLTENFNHLNFNFSGYLFLLGIILFSGSLYLISIYKYSFLGMVAPIGGLCFIIGWAFLAYKIGS